METTTKVVKASELQQVMQEIFELRNPEARSKYEKALRAYLKRLGDKPEVETTIKADDGPWGRKVTGFYIIVEGKPQVDVRPQEPRATAAWGYHEYDRSYGFTTHASQFGLLADPKYNRDIRPQRVDEYYGLMKDGLWQDLLTDPISITSDGHVLNGQHRLAAATRLDWSVIGNDPLFLVVIGVDPAEALHADGSRRTDRDEKLIATKLVGARS